MENPVVSICCICYNQEQYIRQALDGFVMQKTNFPFEVVISDDCSKDGTRAIIAEYKEKYPELIRDVSPEKNKGSIPNWLYAQSACVGQYVALCEGDDYWTDLQKLQKQVDFMEAHEDMGLCITDFCFQSDLGPLSRPAFANGLLKPLNFEQHLVNAGYIGPMTWLYRKNVYNQFVIENNLSDGTFAMALNFFATSKVAYLDDVTAVYRSHVGSATMQTDPVKAFLYLKGVFQTQLHYAEKYECGEGLVSRLKMQGYAEHLLSALEADDVEFVQEALSFYHSKGMEMKWMIEECKRYVDYHRQYEMIKTSKAYKFGRAILYPIKKLLRK